MSNRKTLEERFWSKVDRRGPEDCWLWLPPSGRFYVAKDQGIDFKLMAWNLSFGPKDTGGGLTISTCGNLKCVNPSHLARPTKDERFWMYVEKGPNCWVWTGHRVGMGYGQFAFTAKQPKRAHRYSWEMHYGSIPKGMKVCHHCDNPPCVRPSHLFLGTDADNTADKVRKGRQARGEALAKACEAARQKRKAS